MPIRKVGSDTPTRLTTMNSARQERRCGRCRYRRPSGTPIDEGQHRGGDASSSVAGRRSAIRRADRLGQAVADAEIAVQGGPEEMRVLDEERLVEAELVHQGDALRLGVVLAEHDGDRIADIGEHGEADEADHQQHRDGLQDAGEDEGEHAGSVTRFVGGQVVVSRGRAALLLGRTIAAFRAAGTGGRCGAR